MDRKLEFRQRVPGIGGSLLRVHASTWKTSQSSRFFRPEILLLVLVTFTSPFSLVPYWILVGLVVGIAGFELFKETGKSLPILEMAGALGVLQWLLAPLIQYFLGETHPKFRMYVPSEVYFSYTLPGTSAFLLGLLLFKIQRRHLTPPTVRAAYWNIGIWLVLVGVLVDLFRGWAPGPLRFFISILAMLQYVGLFYCLFSGHAKRWIVLFLVMGLLVFETVGQSMFSNLIIWGSMVTLVYAAAQSVGTKWKLVIGFVALAGIAGLQLVKAEYRRMERNNMAVFVNVVSERLLTEQAWSDSDAWEDLVIRFNQGWIISRIMATVPKEVPFAEGETIWRAIQAALVPRVLNPNKATAGGADLVERFTNLKIGDNTSMGLSPLGEVYANFGLWGGIVMMLGLGLLYSSLMLFLSKQAQREPQFYFWLPFVFYQSVKAETDLLVVLNQLTKGTIMALVCYAVIRRIWPDIRTHWHPRAVSRVKGLAKMERISAEPSDRAGVDTL